MNITLVVAMDKNRGIGFQNTIPWMGKIPSDMKHFRETTTGHPIIMGKNTYLSMGKKVLPNRTNIILSTSLNLTATDVAIARSFEEAVELAKVSPGAEQIFVIGGAQVYGRALAIADQLIITLIDGEFKADTYFPEIDMTEWFVENEQHIQNEKDQFPLHFLTLKRKTIS